MNLFILLLCTFTITATETKYLHRKCPYRSTVDLTNQTHYLNGSYLYQGILIPPEKQSFYNYHILFNNETISVPVHLRGCVCDKRKPCIKLCCAKNEIFNTATYKCERISEDFKMSWNLTIQLPNNRYKMVNVFQQFIHQVGVPCEMPEPLILDIDKWILLENGTISAENEQFPLDTMNYCFTPQKSNKSHEYLLTPLSCSIKYSEPWNLTLNSYAMAVSVFFLISTIVVYTSVKELRANLRGKILICYLLSLTMAYSIICFINIRHTIFEYLTCSLLGYFCYFFFMAAFLWLSVLCYDIWNNFMQINAKLGRSETNKRFIYYSMYAWGWSTLFTLLTLWADLSPIIDKIYKPGVATEMCWINTTKWSAAIYFYGPNMIILIFNFITFTYLTVHIYRVQCDSAIIGHKEQSSQVNAIVILRLFLIMGVSWIFDILSYCLPHTDKWQLMFMTSDLLNALQGPLIFTLFVLKRNVLNLIRNRFSIATPRRSTVSITTKATKLQSSTTSTCEPSK